MLLLSAVTETVHYEERLLDNARQLSELNNFKDKMFNVVAHDIRDPLAVLVNLMELLEEEMQTCAESHDEIVHETGQQIQNTFTLVVRSVGKNIKIISEISDNLQIKKC
jgi:K+-sensing histidine kinase KdpD